MARTETDRSFLPLLDYTTKRKEAPRMGNILIVLGNERERAAVY
jgi:hypothetical protein